MDFLLDFVILGSGVYLVYAAVTMQHKGTVVDALAGRELDLKKVRDLPGYIRYMSVKTAALGVIGAAAGGYGLYNDRTGAAGALQLGVIAVYFIALVLYAVLNARAQKKFLQPSSK